MYQNNRPKTPVRILRPIGVILLLGGVWQLAIWGFQIPSFILPSPTSVVVTLIHDHALLWQQTQITALEVFIGLFLGVLGGLSSALLLMVFLSLQTWFWPILIGSQAIPVFALAPVFMLWFGYGLTSKVLMAAFIIYFPITACCFDGLKRTPKGYLDLAKTLNASPWQTLWRIRLPSALPYFASGLKMAVIFAPIGAVIGEWIGASAGLGYFMLQANAQMHISALFAAVFILASFSLILYFLTHQLLKRLIPWQPETQQ